MLSEPELCSRLSDVVGEAVENSAMWSSLVGDAPPPYHSFAEFRHRVPTVDKQLLFSRSRGQVADSLCGGSLDAVLEVIPSSGTGGDSLGLSFLGRGDLARITGLMDGFLDARFDVASQKTLVLSALPGGVRVPTTSALSLYAGTRPDLAHRLLQHLGDQYAQILIIAEPLYAKRLLEYLHERGYPLRQRRIHLVLGGYYLAENLRDYLAWLLGVRLDRHREDHQRVLSTYGIGEVGLHLLYETPETVALRRFLRDRPRLVARLCGTHLPTAPMILSHDPQRVFVESVDGRLVFTMLEQDRLQPVIRYDSGDWGGFISCHELREHLPAELLSLVPPDGSDLIWSYGRQGVHWTPSALIDTPRTLEALFSEARALWTPGAGPRRGPDLAEADSPSRLLASITGHFSLRGHGVGQARRRNTLKVRLAPERSGRDGWERFSEAQELAPLPADHVKKRVLRALAAQWGGASPDQAGGRSSALLRSIDVRTQGYWEHAKGSLGHLFEAKPRFVQPGPVFRRAFNDKDRARIYKLRHHVFVTEEGLAYEALGAKHQSRMVRDDADNGAAHFLAEIGGKVVGSLRLVTDYEQFEDSQDFDFDGWTYAPQSPDEPEVRTDLSPAEARYGVRFRRDTVAVVGRICVSRAFRGAHLGIVEGLIQMGLHYTLTHGKAAVFLDCMSQHVQRYQAAGFVEYKESYLHRENGQRYHTLLAVVDEMEYRRDEMALRSGDAWRDAWLLVLAGLASRPPEFKNPLDMLLWADLLEQAARHPRAQPLEPESTRYAAIEKLSMGMSGATVRAISARVGALLEMLPDDHRLPGVLAREAEASARTIGSTPEAHAARLIAPLLFGAARHPDPRAWLGTLLEPDLLESLRARRKPLRSLMTLRPGAYAETAESPVRFSFVYKQVCDAVLQVLWERGDRENAISLRGYYRYRAMVHGAGNATVRALLPKREEARLAIQGRVSGSIRAPMVGSPFLRRAEALADPGSAPEFEPEQDWSTRTEPSPDLSTLEEQQSSGEWLHTRYSSLEEAFVLDGAPDCYRTEHDTVVYITRGQVQLLPLDGDGEGITVGEGHVLSAVATLADGVARFRARAVGDVVLGAVDRRRFLFELERDSYMSLTLARQLVMAHRDWTRAHSSTHRFELTMKRGANLARQGLPDATYRQLAEGLEPRWRVRGLPLCSRGDFADHVYLIELGRVLYARTALSPSLLTPLADMDAEAAALEEKLRAQALLVSVSGHRKQLVGFASALLPLDDPMVSGSRGNGRSGVPLGGGVRGATEGDARRGPQPERHDLTAIVGRQNAIVYELPREEFVRRLEEKPALARDVCRQMARAVALQEALVIENGLPAHPEAEAVAQLLRNTRQLSSPPSPIAIA